jgi:hypothetical protein
MVWAQIFNRLVFPTQARRTPAQYRTRARRRAWLGHSIRHISTSPQPFCFGATASHFEVHGSLADVYFECHYIEVATGVKMSDVSYGRLGQPSTGQAQRIRGKWLLSFAEVGSPALSSGY